MNFPRAGQVWRKGNVVVKVRHLKLSGALVHILEGGGSGSFLPWDWFDDARRIG